MTNITTKYEIIKFEDGDFSLDVNVSPNEETVWLTQAQIAELFDVNIPAINKHVKHILSSCELDNSTISNLSLKGIGISSNELAVAINITLDKSYSSSI